MKRDEATKLLREVIQVCDGIGEGGFILMAPNVDNELSHGYQVHIKSWVSEDKIACLKPLIDRYKLAIANQPGKQLIIIYRPMQEEKQLLQA